MTDWISVKDRLPELWTKVMLVHKDGRVGMGSLIVTNDPHGNDREILYGFTQNPDESEDVKFPDITHWQPLPEPPKEEGQ